MLLQLKRKAAALCLGITLAPPKGDKAGTMHLASNLCPGQSQDLCPGQSQDQKENVLPIHKTTLKP